MSASLDEFLVKIVRSKKTRMFVDELWISQQSSKYRGKLRQSVKTKHYLEMDATDLTEAGVVSAIAQFKVILDSQSAYRKATDFLESKTDGVMVFHQSHLLAANVLHLISRLIRYTQRQNLEWKFIFFGDSKAMQSLKIDQLFIEKSYPSRRINSAIKKQSLGIVTTLICLAALVLVFIVKPVSKDNSLGAISTSDTSTSIESTDLQVNQATEETDASNELFEMIRQSKLRDLEFNGILAELDSQADIVNETDNPDARKSNEPAAEKLNASQTINKQLLRLSSDAENAILNNDIEVVQKLLNSDELRLSQNSNGQTPLIIATNNGSQQIVKWLLSKKTLVNSIDRYGRSAVFYASINGDDAILKVLLSTGAHADIGSNLSKTPLMAAVHNDHISIVEALLNNNVDVDAVDHSGWSAVFYAVWNSNISMVQLLIDNNANINIKDNSGLSLVEIAEAKGNSRIIDLL